MLFEGKHNMHKHCIATRPFSSLWTGFVTTITGSFEYIDLLSTFSGSSSLPKSQCKIVCKVPEDGIVKAT